MFIGVSRSGGVAERSNAAVLKLMVADAPNGKTWQASCELGIKWHRCAAPGSRVGIKPGINRQTGAPITPR
jgi:hypothetical protein